LQPLIDRIEVVNVPAYLPIEKFGIAKEYLIPRLEEEYGFKETNEKVLITDAAIRNMIINYCGHEAGVRNLRKCLDRVFRKIVAKLEAQKQKDLEVARKEAISKILESRENPASAA
jgi:ATP-dependent Lon protease